MRPYRVTSAEVRTEPDLFERGVEAFNQGRYFEAHEHWEALWTPLAGDERRRLQGLIHFAVGLHHRGRGNGVGAARQLRKGLAKTDGAAADWRGVNLEELRRAMAAALASIERQTPPPAPARIQRR